MKAKGKREEHPPKTYDVEDLYGLYKLIKRFPGQDFNNKSAEKMIKAKDSHSSIKAMTPEQLLTLHEKVAPKEAVFLSLMKDFDRTKKDNASLHTTITKTLVETFLETEPKKKTKEKKPAKEKNSDITPEKPAVEQEFPTPGNVRALLKENKASSVYKSLPVFRQTYDFKLVLQKRFEHIDLNKLSREGEKPRLCQLFSQADKEWVDKMEAEKKPENHDFIERIKMIMNKAIPEDMMRSPLLNEKSTELILQEIKYRLTLLKGHYKKSTEEISKMYYEVSGDIDLVEKVCQGLEVAKWNELEDMALRAGQSSKEYQFLMASKGKDEIKKRKKFLML